MGIGLMSAVLAAYWKHQYKMWDVNAREAQQAVIQQRRRHAQVLPVRT